MVVVCEKGEMRQGYTQARKPGDRDRQGRRDATR